MSDRNVEDGMGWGGLVVSKAEREEARRIQATADAARAHAAELERVKAERDALRVALRRTVDIGRLLDKAIGGDADELLAYVDAWRKQADTADAVIAAIDAAREKGVG